jgi:hypothetical protein
VHVAILIKGYSEFLESPPGYVDTDILRKAFRKDKSFVQWKQGRDERADAARPRASRKQEQPDALPATTA